MFNNNIQNLLSLDDFKAEYTLFITEDNKIIKYSIYSHHDIKFAVNIPPSSLSDTDPIFLHASEFTPDDKIMRFTTLYDKVYNQYIFISNGIVLFKNIIDGLKYYDMFTATEFNFCKPTIIPIYTSKIKLNLKTFKIKLRENHNLMTENIETSKESKRIQLLKLLGNISELIESDNYNDSLFVELYNIYIHMKKIKKCI